MITWLVVSGQTGGRGPRRAEPRSNCKPIVHSSTVRQEPHPPGTACRNRNAAPVHAGRNLRAPRQRPRETDLRNRRAWLDNREGEAPAEPNHAPIAKQPITKARFGRSLTLPALHAAIETQHRFMPVATSAPHGNGPGKRTYEITERGWIIGRARLPPSRITLQSQNGRTTKARFGRSLTLPALLQ